MLSSILLFVNIKFYIKEKPQTGCTTTKKDTINPGTLFFDIFSMNTNGIRMQTFFYCCFFLEFNESFKVSIDRKNQSFVRQCKRQVLTVKVNHVR